MIIFLGLCGISVLLVRWPVQEVLLSLFLVICGMLILLVLLVQEVLLSRLSLELEPVGGGELQAVGWLASRLPAV